MRLLLFDTETQGFPSSLSVPLHLQPEVVEFAGGIVDTDNIDAGYQETLEFRVRTRKALTPRIEDLLGISDAELDKEKPFKAYYPALHDFFSRVDGWVAHNLEFDRKMMAIEMARLRKINDFPWPSMDICTLNLSRTLFSKGPHKMRDFAYRVGAENSRQSHRAMDDVDMLLEIVQILLPDGDFPLESNWP